MKSVFIQSLPLRNTLWSVPSVEWLSERQQWFKPGIQLTQCLLDCRDWHDMSLEFASGLWARVMRVSDCNWPWIGSVRSACLPSRTHRALSVSLSPFRQTVDSLQTSAHWVAVTHLMSNQVEVKADKLLIENRYKYLLFLRL